MPPFLFHKATFNSKCISFLLIMIDEWNLEGIASR